MHKNGENNPGLTTPLLKGNSQPQYNTQNTTELQEITATSQASIPTS